MNNAFNFDEYGNVLPATRSRQAPPSNMPQYEVPRWRQERAPRQHQHQQSFPPLDMIGSESYSSRMAPPLMDRHANRSRSPMNMERRPYDYRSRTPPTQYNSSSSFAISSRQPISYPRPLYPSRDGSPPRRALRTESPPKFSSPSRLPYPMEDDSPQRPQLRLSPVPRTSPAPRETTPPQFRLRRSPSPAPRKTTPPPSTRPSAGPISSVTRELIPQPRSTPDYSSEERSELIPRPLNLRSNPTSRKDITSVCEYLSLDELENLWQSQDLYSGTIAVPTKPCATSPLFSLAGRMAPVGPMSPSLADHPAFRNEHRAYNSFACA